jgi:Ubiquitinol-cytochrome C reductase Fe-S subunit TAT signal
MRDGPERRASLNCVGGVELASATTIEAPNRRDFLFLTAAALSALGAAAADWPLREDEDRLTPVR